MSGEIGALGETLIGLKCVEMIGKTTSKIGTTQNRKARKKKKKKR